MYIQKTNERLKAEKIAAKKQPMKDQPVFFKPDPVIDSFIGYALSRSAIGITLGFMKNSPVCLVHGTLLFAFMYFYNKDILPVINSESERLEKHEKKLARDKELKRLKDRMSKK